MSEQGQSVTPIIGIIVVAIVLLAVVYANVTGMFAVSGAKVVGKNTAFIIVAILFLITAGWAYRRAQAN